MKKHPNFYENLKEASMRLKGTVVVYEGEPYYVMAISDHKGDGIYRIYLDRLGRTKAESALVQGAYSTVANFPPEHPSVGVALDQWMTQNASAGLVRKYANSSGFNNFRPFPLGMCNITGTDYGNCFYVERQPNRKTEQGLTRSMLYQSLVTAGSRADNPRIVPDKLDVMGMPFKNCIVADHPSAKDCLAALNNPQIANEAVAFHRNFALVRGPIEMIFLAYKADIIGVLPKNNFEYLKLGREFAHCREVVEELRLFSNIMK